MEVFTQGTIGHDFYRSSMTTAINILTNKNKSDIYYVLDKTKDVICFCDLGGHISATGFILNKYYGLSFYKKNDVKILKDIIEKNFDYYNAKVHDPEYYLDEVLYNIELYID